MRRGTERSEMKNMKSRTEWRSLKEFIVRCGGRPNREMVFLKMYEFGLSAVGVREVEVVGGASNCPPTLFSFSALA
jgi:hypothetical protein